MIIYNVVYCIFFFLLLKKKYFLKFLSNLKFFFSNIRKIFSQIIFNLIYFYDIYSIKKIFYWIRIINLLENFPWKLKI
jgi:hypothetical protein